MQAPSAGSAGAQPNNAVQTLDAIRVERRAWGSSEWTSAGHRDKPTSGHKCLCAPGLRASSDGWEKVQQNELNPECQADTGRNIPGDAQTQVFALKTTEPRQKSFVSKMGEKLRIGLCE